MGDDGNDGCSGERLACTRCNPALLLDNGRALADFVLCLRPRMRGDVGLEVG